MHRIADIIDPAMLRPGRLGKHLYVKLPNAQERESILKKHLRRSPIDETVDVTKVLCRSKERRTWSD